MRYLLCGAGLIVMLVAAMLLSVTPVCADPGLSVNITIEGEDPDVWINGHNLKDPIAVYNEYKTVHQGASCSCIDHIVGKSLEPLYAWTDEAGVRFELLASGLANTILLIGEFPNDGQTIAGILASYNNTLVVYNSTLALHDSRLDGLSNSLVAQAEAAEAIDNDNDNQFLMIVGVGVLALAGVVSSSILAIKLRRR